MAGAGLDVGGGAAGHLCPSSHSARQVRGEQCSEHLTTILSLTADAIDLNCFKLSVYAIPSCVGFCQFRGQTSLLYFQSALETPGMYFYLVVAGLLALHAVVLVSRAVGAGAGAVYSSYLHLYNTLGWPVWILLLLLPLASVAGKV